MRQGGVLSPVLHAIYIDDLILKLVKPNLGCCIGDMNVCCLVYADDIVLLSGSLHKLQLMLNICNAEMNYLDLKFNTSKCHVLRIGENYGNECSKVCWGNSPIDFVDFISYLGTVIRAGRTWRIDSSSRRRQCFRAFNGVYCKCASLPEPAVQNLVDSFCKPVLPHHLHAKISQNLKFLELNMPGNLWCLYGVLNKVYAHTNCLVQFPKRLFQLC